MRLTILKRVLCAFLLLAPSFGHATRRVATSICSSQYMYIELSNPSTVTQTVKIDFYSTGISTLSLASGQWGNLAATCPTTTHCTNSSLYNTIPAGQHLSIGVRAVTLSGSSNPRSGTSGRIEITEDTGYLVGHARCQNSGEQMIIPLNGGNPF